MCVCVYIYIYILFPSGLLRDIEYSSLGYAVRPPFFPHCVYTSLRLLTPDSQSVPPRPLPTMVSCFRGLWLRRCGDRAVGVKETECSHCGGEGGGELREEGLREGRGPAGPRRRGRMQGGPRCPNVGGSGDLQNPYEKWEFQRMEP